MKIVVADTSPLNYLVLTESVDLLRQLYTRVVIPVEVFDELAAAGSTASELLVDLRSALAKLRRTNFRVSQALIDSLLSGA